MYVLHLSEVLPLQLRKDHRHHQRPIKHEVLHISFRFDNSETYIPPYCEEHLRKRVEDCHEKIKKFKNTKDEGKASQFSQMVVTYTGKYGKM